MSTAETESHMTNEEAAVYLDVSIATIYNWRRRGVLTTVEVLTKKRLSRESVLKAKQALDVIRNKKQEVTT